MKFEFNQGVPRECVNWLWQNIGAGNVYYSSAGENVRRDRLNIDDWYCERIEVPIPSTDPSRDSNARYVPTIFIDDEKKAILFALRWL